MVKKRIKVCCFTGSRAEYGLLSKLIERLGGDNMIDNTLIITGAHLSSLFGNTAREIVENNGTTMRKLYVNMEPSRLDDMAEITADVIRGVSRLLKEIEPEILVCLGDRYETYAAATAAHLNKIKIMHIHGGEETGGAIDDRLRNAITQLSTWHFTSHEIYAENVKAMTKDTTKVITVGPMAIDALQSQRFISQKEFEMKTDYKFSTNNILMTYHPETLKEDGGINGLSKLLNAIEEIDCNTLITYPNADKGSQQIISIIEDYASKNNDCVYLCKSLGHELYTAALRLFDVMVGNSSSGIIEGPLTGIKVLNIGDRQKGRIREGEIYDVGENDDLLAALKKILEKEKSKNKKYKELNEIQSPSKVIIEKIRQIATQQ